MDLLIWSQPYFNLFQVQVPSSNILFARMHHLRHQLLHFQPSMTPALRFGAPNLGDGLKGMELEAMTIHTIIKLCRP